MIFRPRIFARQICLQCLHLIREQTKTRTIHNLFNPASRAKLTYSSKKVNLTTPLFLKAEEHPDRVAVVDTKGSYTYSDILKKTKCLTKTILQLCDERIDIGGSRVGILCPNDHMYVVAQWAVWRSGGVAVPLCRTHPPPEWEYFLQDSESDLVITTDEFAEKLGPVASKTSTKLHVMEPGSIFEDDETEDSLDEHENDRMNRINQCHGTNKFKHEPALIVYTSGTTGKPKGVVHTFGSLQAQMDDMVSAWEWSPQDVLLHVLPLHHVHGIVNALMTPLYVGATCVMLPKFDAREVWSTLLTLSPLTPLLPRSINLFMAVPTIYAKLIEEYNSRFNTKSGLSSGQEFVKAVCSTKFRLMVSGSAALPQPIMMRWHEITGQMLLERYGMTELGMALTNPLFGPRIPGSVGQPFPGVEVCIGKPNVYADSGYDVIAQGTAKHTKETPGMEGEEGELYVKGPNVFKEYWRKPEATAATFTKDGWFKTGDTACFKDRAYKILGRTSVDIIKSGGYKISALDIERHLLSHDDITDVAVLGLPDMTWGQKVAAVVVLQAGKTLDLQDLKKWAENKMPSYEVPSVVKVLTDMPRNAMGKVNKKELVNTVFPNEMKGYS